MSSVSYQGGLSGDTHLFVHLVFLTCIVGIILPHRDVAELAGERGGPRRSNHSRRMLVDMPSVTLSLTCGALGKELMLPPKVGSQLPMLTA